MKSIPWITSVFVAITTLAAHGPTFAQPKEQFFPLIVYRTGPYAPNGTPMANGKLDYLKLINARDGGINGVKLTYEECETAYATDKGVECYERLKGRPGVALFEPQTTGVTFALTDRAPTDKIPLLTSGYGLAISQDGTAFPWNFPMLGSYWTASDIMVQHLRKKEGGVKGKKIVLLYHDSAFGKEPIPMLQAQSRQHGFELVLIPVTPPGLEQKSAWLQVRQQRPDYLIMWGWGAMNSAALREAQATGYPREKMFGMWWAGAEPDVRDIGEGAKGYSALTLNPSGQQLGIVQQILAQVHDKSAGSGPRDDVGSVLYVRGVVMQALAIEATRTAQERFGKGKVMTPQQVRWGLENLTLDAKRLRALGLADVIRPLSTSCSDHMGSANSWVQVWDGKKWVIEPEPMQADTTVIRPMVRAASDKYLVDKGLTRRPPSDCQL